ncbi:hypothetical protein AM500_05585 [Bacillus sp. FJAT-18017]|nr:hypothetical protein AM500_05585 [Bacillus sp. FJAT-18017]
MHFLQIFKLAMLMGIVDLLALMIGAEGAKTRSKMQRAHFLLRCIFWGDYPTSYGRKGQCETPQEQSDEEIEKRGDCSAPTSAGGPEAEVAL